MPARRPPSRRARTSPVRLGRGRSPKARELRDARDALYREHIMEVAEGIFAERGFLETRMQDIAAAAGISLGTLYQSYASKQELHRGLLIERDRQMIERIAARAAPGLRALAPGDSVEQVLWFMEGHLQFMLDHPGYLRMQLQEGHAWYHGAAQPTQAEQDMWKRGLALLAQTFRSGINRGAFSPGDPEDQGRTLMAIQQARLANWVIGGMKQEHAAVIEGIQADFVRLFCRPDVAARMLSPDGAGLSDATRSKLKQLRSP